MLGYLERTNEDPADIRKARREWADNIVKREQCHRNIKTLQGSLRCKRAVLAVCWKAGVTFMLMHLIL